MKAPGKRLIRCIKEIVLVVHCMVGYLVPTYYHMNQVNTLFCLNPFTLEYDMEYVKLLFYLNPFHDLTWLQK